MTTKGAKTRIAHIVRQYHPSIGGLETYVEELATRQTRRHRVFVITLNRLFGSRVPLRRIERVGRLIVIRVPYLGSRVFFVPMMRARLLRRFDIKHVHATDQLLDYTGFWGRIQKFPYFVTTHGLFFHTQHFALIKRVYFHLITRRSLARSAAVFAVSANDRATVKKVGVDSLLLRNPIVPLGDFVVSGTDLIYIGRIAHNKRVDRLLTFMSELAQLDPTARLHIVGSDPDRLWPGLQASLKGTAAEARVRYHGYMARESLLPLLHSCGYIASASEYEGFGLSIVEGMSVGLIPVMNDNAAFRETLELSGCGLICSFENPRGAARRFLNWRESVTERDRHCAASFARKHSWDTVVDTVEEFYARAIKKVKCTGSFPDA